MDNTVKGGRDDTMSIVKGILIILMVIGHAGIPKGINDFLYSFHMPAFIIASGYFFKLKYLDNKWGYFQRKTEGIYFPFVKYSIIFLLLHNVFFYFGIINDQYGSASGECARWFSVYGIIQTAINIVTRMEGYDFMLLAGFWFLRALYIGSLLFCFSFWLLNSYLKRISFSVVIVTCLFCLFAGAKAYSGKDIPNWPMGGYRELMAVFFIGSGFIISSYFPYILKSKACAIVSAIILCSLYFIHPTNMGYAATFQDWCFLPFTGICGFIILYYISSLINRKKSKIRDWLVYVGGKTFYILAFHIVMFKPASLLKTWIYGLDWKMIGCHIVIRENNNWYWVVYTITAIVLSLLFAKLCDRTKFFKI